MKYVIHVNIFIIAILLKLFQYTITVYYFMVMQVCRGLVMPLYSSNGHFVILFLNGCDPQMHFGGYVQCTCNSFCTYDIFVMLYCVHFQFCLYLFLTTYLTSNFWFVGPNHRHFGHCS